jgi:hypothetical protein
LSKSNPPPTLIGVRAGLILLLGVLFGSVIGVLAVLSGVHLAAACGISFFNKIICSNSDK